MKLPSFTTIDKAIVTALGFVITVGGLVAEYGGLVHLPSGWLAICAAVVGVATTLLTYLQPNKPANVARAERATKRRTATEKSRKTAGAHPHPDPQDTP